MHKLIFWNSLLENKANFAEYFEITVKPLKMSIINNVLGLFLGNKYERDLKEINPYIDKIHNEFKKLRKPVK